VTWGEVRAAEPRIRRWIADGVSVSRGGRACALTAAPIAIARHAGTLDAALSYSLSCPGEGTWSFDYRLLFERDRTHRALLAVAADEASSSAAAVVLDVDHHRWMPGSSGWLRFGEFVRQGIWHIWLGYDHIAFLLLLLLPAVLERDAKEWVGARSLGGIARHTLGVVTAFTVAHSITLSLATLGILRPPVMPVEAGIAATVVIAGLANLYPRYAAHGARIAFGFGLIHGFGFANALAELGIARGDIVAPLAGFNIGVELGQLGIVALTLPLLACWRQRWSYRHVFMPAASLTVAALAAWWLLQRTGVV